MMYLVPFKNIYLSKPTLLAITMIVIVPILCFNRMLSGPLTHGLKIFMKANR